MTAAAALPSFYRLLRHDRIASTSEEAKRLAAAGAPEGTLVIAREQTAGHGRRGRSWISPPGNLYASLVLRPAVAPAIAAQLGFAAALAVGDLVRPMLSAGGRLTYKWPNDVLLAGRKLAGILLESQTTPAAAVAWAVLGIGINLRSSPENVDYPAISLAEAGTESVSAETALISLAGHFLDWYQRWNKGLDFAAIRSAWLAAAQGLGEPLRVRLERAEFSGRFEGLDEDGALLLRESAGLRRVTAGEVFFDRLDQHPAAVETAVSRPPQAEDGL